MKINRANYFRFRCTHLEKEIIKKKAENCGLSASAYIRRASLNQKIGYRLTEEEIKLYQTLTKYANNFQSLSNLFKNKDPRLSQEIEQLVKEIKKHLKKFQ